MRFQLIDRIEAVEAGNSLRAIKHLTLAEEYLADHFPSFPVMPGVLQLQALVEAGSWLLRVSEGFMHSIWALREVRGVKFGTFVSPGHRLDVAVELAQRGESSATIKGRGTVDGQQSITATMTLVGYNLRETQPSWAERDKQLVDQLRSRYEWLIADCQQFADAGQGRLAAEAKE